MLAKALEFIMAVEAAVLPTRLMSWELIICQNRLFRNKWDEMVHLTEAARNEITWWIENLNRWNGRSMIRKIPEEWIRTGASKEGWGATLPQRDWLEAQGRWSMSKREQINNTRELRGMDMGVMAF